MLAKTFGAAHYGVDAVLITIEVNVLSSGNKFFLVGLPDNAVKESEQRVYSSLKNNGFKMPRQQVVINMAPADIRKQGASYDLPIALAILTASEQLNAPIEEYMIMGELALDGTLRPIKGALPLAIEARKQGLKGFILPKENASEAAIVNKLEIIGVETLAEAVAHLEGLQLISPTVVDTREIFLHEVDEFDLDFAEVQGQQNIKRALEIAAAGGHNVLMIGPPGAGKTMLAQRVPSILPPLSLSEALETTKIHSVAGKLKKNTALISKRPFRAPHHTISDVALVGGGSNPMPGEISLAHNGVLFLDELTEFKRTTLEVLRQPLENREVTISRAKISVDYPANFMLIASMNPTPFGFQGKAGQDAFWNVDTVHKAISKLSGPLLDRIDMHLEVNPVSFDEMTAREKGEPSQEIRKRVIKARQMQLARFEKTPNIHSNSMMNSQQISAFCSIDKDGKVLLKSAMERMGFSARTYDRILKVSRTIADLSGSEKIRIEHLAEAIQYRNLDKEQVTPQ